MIKISVDEAYAFDYLSILQLKKNNGSNVDNIINIITSELQKQIGHKKLDSILKSEEYKNLYDSNKKTFEAVDKAKTDEVKASYVDQCNYNRMLNKQILQEIFFGGNLTETKLGYEKLKIKNG